jgi:hypothetical protein
MMIKAFWHQIIENHNLDQSTEAPTINHQSVIKAVSKQHQSVIQAQSITKHHRASQSITKHHKASQSITKHLIMLKHKLRVELRRCSQVRMKETAVSFCRFRWFSSASWSSTYNSQGNLTLFSSQDIKISTQSHREVLRQRGCVECVDDSVECTVDDCVVVKSENLGFYVNKEVSVGWHKTLDFRL